MEYFRKEQSESGGILKNFDEVQTNQTNSIEESLEDNESFHLLKGEKKEEKKKRKEFFLRKK